MIRLGCVQGAASRSLFVSGENPFSGIIFIPSFYLPVFIFPWQQVMSQNAGVKSPYQLSAFPGETTLSIIN